MVPKILYSVRVVLAGSMLALAVGGCPSAQNIVAPILDGAADARRDGPAQDVAAKIDVATRIDAAADGRGDVFFVDAAVASIDDIAVGGTHACAIRAAEVWCWGRNSHGEVGDSTQTPRFRPTRLKHAWPAAPVELALGYYHSCVRLANRTVWCWGSTADGQLGNTISNTPVLTPTQVPGIATADQVVAGSYFTCVREAGVLRCFGNNAYGQLGNGSTARRASPLPVTGLPPIAQVSAGGFNICARTDQSVFCWGAGADGAIGDGAAVDRNVPTEVVAHRGTGVLQLSVMGLSSCARRAGCQVLCWGRSNNGVVGYSTGSESTKTPTVVAGTGAGCSEISHTCALGSTLLCWADNAGVAGGTATPMPVAVPSPTRITTGYNSRCAVSGGRELYCWGRNADGQLGTGSTTATEVPIRVVF